MQTSRIRIIAFIVHAAPNQVRLLAAVYPLVPCSGMRAIAVGKDLHGGQTAPRCTSLGAHGCRKGGQ